MHIYEYLLTNKLFWLKKMLHMTRFNNWTGLSVNTTTRFDVTRKIIHQISNESISISFDKLIPLDLIKKKKKNRWYQCHSARLQTLIET